MAGAESLGPSEANYLVESSTAHDDLLFLVSTSCTGEIKLLGSSSDASSPAIHPQPPSFPSPEMSESLNPTPAQPGRRAISLPPNEKLGFSLVGSTILGPLRFLSPVTNGVVRGLPLRLFKFVRISNLFHPSQSLCRLMEPFVRRLHLEHKSSLLLVWFEISLENLLLDSLRDLAFEVRSLNEIGIIIQTLWSCDYRYVFRLPPLSHMLSEPFKLQIINFLKSPPKHLKTSGIMIPNQWSWGYHKIFKCLTPAPRTATNSFITLNLSTINRAQILDKAFLQRPLVRIPSSMSKSLMTMTIESSVESLEDVPSSNRDLTCSKLPLGVGIIALMDYYLMFYVSTFMFKALGKALLCIFLNLGALIPLLVCDLL